MVFHVVGYKGVEKYFHYCELGVSIISIQD